MRKKIFIREFTGWLVASLILPLISPFVIALICLFWAATVGSAILDFGTLLETLLDKGVYAFFSIAILLSLFTDYKIAENVIKGIVFIPYLFFLIGLGFLFIDSLGLIKGVSTFSISDKREMFIYLSLCSVIFAIVLKLIIINRKIGKV